MLDQSKTCRCCLMEVKNQDLYEFSSEVAIDDSGPNPTNFVKIVDAFIRITTINVAKNDEDVSKICSTCLQDLRISFIFQRRCLDANQYYCQEFARSREEKQPITEFEEIVQFKTEIKPEEEEMNVIEYIEEEYLDGGELQEDSAYEIIEEYPDMEHFVGSKKKITSKRVKNESTAIYECTGCTKTFDKKDYYRRHYRRLHLKTRIEDAAESLASEGKLDEIKNLRLYQCEHCGKIEVIKEDFDNHSAEHEGEELFKCKRCDERFTSKEFLKNHMSVHNEEKTFICDVCGKAFRNKYALSLHYRRHTGEKPYKCPICERGFSMTSNLQKHINSHSDARPYGCDECGQFFKTTRSLKFHTICFHKTEAKIKCPSCDKAFVNKSYLKMHQQYHTGEKNFTCTICNSKYYKSSHLKRHIQNVHFKLRLLKCDFCSSDFVRKETYRAHVINHHKRHLTTEVLNETLEKIKNFRPPALEIDQFILEKQKFSSDQIIVSEVEGGEMFDMEGEIVEEIEMEEYEHDGQTEEYGEHDEEMVEDEQDDDIEEEDEDE